MTRPISPSTRENVIRNYKYGDPEELLVRRYVGLTPRALNLILAPEKTAFAVELYRFGFKIEEIAVKLGYTHTTVKHKLKAALSPGEFEISEQDRISKAITEVIKYSVVRSGQKSQSPYEHRAMREFYKAKLPKIIAQAVKSVNLGELANQPKDPYERLLFEAMRGGFPTGTKMGNYTFEQYVKSQPRDVSVEGLIAYLKTGIATNFREELKFPANVDRQGIEAALDTLTEREKDVIKRRIFDGQTLREVADFYGRRPERIRQIESKALRKLRKKPVFKLADPKSLQVHVRDLEATVVELNKKLQLKDSALAGYETGDEKIEQYDPQLRANVARTIDDLELSVRTRNCLITGRIKYIGHLVQKQENDLLKTKNFGRKSLNEIKSSLELWGLHLAMKLPPDLEADYRLHPE